MALPVVMKSGKNYLTLVLDEELPFAELLQEIVAKFRESEKFFGTEPIAIAFEGRKLSETENLQIMDAIDCYTNVRIAVLIEQDKLMEYAADAEIRKSLYPEEMELDQISEEAVCTFIPRDVRAGEEIVSLNTVVVFGDVEKGASVRSAEHVIVLGALFGEAAVGTEGNTDSRIFALQFAPEDYRIADLAGDPIKKKGLFQKDLNRRRFREPKTAAIVNGVLQIDTYT